LLGFSIGSFVAQQIALVRPAIVRRLVLASGTRGTSLPGQLTIRGISGPVTLQTEYLGNAADPWGGYRAITTVTAPTKPNR